MCMLKNMITRVRTIVCNLCSSRAAAIKEKGKNQILKTSKTNTKIHVNFYTNC